MRPGKRNRTGYLLRTVICQQATIRKTPTILMAQLDLRVSVARNVYRKGR
jgi:hypothetical protein